MIRVEGAEMRGRAGVTLPGPDGSRGESYPLSVSVLDAREGRRVPGGLSGGHRAVAEDRDGGARPTRRPKTVRGRPLGDAHYCSVPRNGFALADVRHVTIWQGTEDQHVPSFHAEWLAGHLPQAELRTLDGEAHNSIVRHLPEIVRTLIANGQPADT